MASRDSPITQSAEKPSKAKELPSNLRAKQTEPQAVDTVKASRAGKKKGSSKHVETQKVDYARESVSSCLQTSLDTTDIKQGSSSDHSFRGNGQKRRQNLELVAWL
jgi:hypothetical protein